MKTKHLEVKIGAPTGDVIVREDEVAAVTARELKRWGMTRADLTRVFAEGAKLMRGRDADRVMPCADQRLDGEWVVYPLTVKPTA